MWFLMIKCSQISMAEGVRESFLSLLQQRRRMTRQEAEATMQELKEQQRFVEEIFV